jgi:hypothetical protein
MVDADEFVLFPVRLLTFQRTVSGDSTLRAFLQLRVPRFVASVASVVGTRVVRDGPEHCHRSRLVSLLTDASSYLITMIVS